MTCSFVVPGGLAPPMTPAKMRSVARPRIFGPTELSTLTTASTSTTTTLRPVRRSLPSRRLADGPKFSDFSPGWPICMCGGPPRRAGPRRASAAFSSLVLTPSAIRPPPPRCAGTRRSPGRSHRCRRAGRACPADDAAVLEHEDLVGVDDRRHALGHDDDGALRRGRAQGPAQPGIGRQVERRERVVEEVDVGPLDDGPCDGQPLPLATRDVGAALGDRGVEAAHRLDEVLALGDAQRVPQLVVRGLGVAVAQVRRHRAAEEVRLLRDEPDACSTGRRARGRARRRHPRAPCRTRRRRAAARDRAGWSCRSRSTR